MAGKSQWVLRPLGHTRNEVDAVRRLRNQNMNHTEGLPYDTGTPTKKQRRAFACCHVVGIQGLSISFPVWGPE